MSLKEWAEQEMGEDTDNCFKCGTPVIHDDDLAVILVQRDKKTGELHEVAGVSAPGTPMEFYAQGFLHAVLCPECWAKQIETDKQFISVLGSDETRKLIRQENTVILQDVEKLIATLEMYDSKSPQLAALRELREGLLEATKEEGE